LSPSVHPSTTPEGPTSLFMVRAEWDTKIIDAINNTFILKIKKGISQITEFQKMAVQS
jgi:hypothetical protein